MATPDKESHRGNAGRDSNQPAESAGEAQSSQVAARSVNPALTPPRAVRHETWLGIFVVIVLMFALGFLVYQKVERHERLANVAIQGQADNTVSAEQAIAAAATAEFPQDSDADPLAAQDPNAGQLASNLSPFADSPSALSDTAESPSTIASTETSLASTEPDFAPLAEPAMDSDAVADTQAGSPQFGELALAGDPNESAEFSNLTQPGAAAVAESAAALGSDPQQPFGSLEEPAMAADSSSLPTGDFAESLAPVTDTANSPALPGFDNLPGEQQSLAENSKSTSASVAASTDSTAPEMQSESPSELTAANDGGLPDFSLSPGDTSDVPAFADQPSADPDAAEAAVSLGTPQLDLSVPLAGTDGQTQPVDDQPQLLALAEPQQQSPFGEFNPGSASSSPAADRNASAGFRAVTRPAVSQRHQGSPGATGADRDGRFSLAAFNTQNASVAAGKDDGEKHNSIIVQNGENYSKISKRVYGTTRYFSALAVFNQHRISNPNAMRPGMIVLTPDPKLLEERYPQLFLDRQPKVTEPAGFFLLDDGSPAYRVGARETLSDISQRFLGRSTRWGEIYQLNRSVLTDPNTLKPGIVLALPEDATEVQLIP